MKIKVVELFAGVGGFRIGLEGFPKKKNAQYEVVWSNQWEPSTKKQHANIVYTDRFGTDNHSGNDISTVKTEDIPDHDMLVGGFPCQDYSVATTLKRSGGLVGKKGVLWWQIHRILEEKDDLKPKYLLLENVDRLLKSPSTQRGRDFAIMLSSLNSLGYAVEWKIINAADYGMPQRRRRIFIVAYHKSTHLYKKLTEANSKLDWINDEGICARAFPSAPKDNKVSSGVVGEDLIELSDNFNKGEKLSPFFASGVMINGAFDSINFSAKYTGIKKTLADVLVDENDVPEEFYIDTQDIEKWTYLKGAKNEERFNKQQNFKYKYTEGAMVFPDSLDNASRTIITGEGGKSASRFKHVINSSKGLRRLTPVELERLNMFPDNHTLHSEVTDAKRAFFMGNALVVGVVERFGEILSEEINH